jgi:enterochelin esterase-like enzyme
MASSIDAPTRRREGHCNPSFVEFLAEELLPWARRRCHVVADPARVVLVGASATGLAAAFAALRRPDRFGNVLSLSGAFGGPATAPGSLTRAFVLAGRVPVRFYLEVGRSECRQPPGTDLPSLLQANRHLRDVLEAKGYTVAYREHPGTHDPVWLPGTLTSGLVTLLGREVTTVVPTA